MSKADNMFEELGYEIEYEDETSFTLANKEKAKMITFMKQEKELMLPILSIEELQAVYLKCKELGWLDE